MNSTIPLKSTLLFRRLRLLQLPTLLNSSRMQAQVVDLNGKIESVNRERKYHQQNTAYELSELSKQWRELCLKNIDIEAACVEIDGAIKQMKSEAAARGWDLETNIQNGHHMSKNEHLANNGTKS